MVCRSVPGTSVPMGLAKIETSLDDAQIQSLMHQLRHECDPTFGRRAALTAGTVDEEEGLRQRWRRTCATLNAAIRQSSDLRPQRRAGLHARLDSATEPPPPDMQYACEGIRERAISADKQLTQLFRAAAAVEGIHEHEIRTRFAELRAEAPHGRQSRATPEERQRWQGLPLDPATRYALARVVRPRAAGAPPGPPVIPAAAREPVLNPQSLVATIGYDPDSRRIEVELTDGRVLAYRNTSQRILRGVRDAAEPDLSWQTWLSRPEHRYPTAEVAQAYGERRRCPGCGQFCSLEHRCLGPAGELPRQRGGGDPELLGLRSPEEPTPSTIRTEYIAVSDPFQDPDNPRQVGIRTYDLADLVEQLRYSDDDGLLIPLTAGNDHIDISGYVTVTLHGDQISVIAGDDSAVNADDRLRCSCSDAHGEDCNHIRDALGVLHRRISQQYTTGVADIGAAAEDLARRHRAAGATPNAEPLSTCTISYVQNPELFEADVAAALTRHPDQRVAWRDPRTETDVIGDGSSDRRFGVELEFDVAADARPFGTVSGDEEMANVETVEYEQQVLGHYDEEIKSSNGEWITKVRFGYHDETVEELQLDGDPEPTLQTTVITRVGDALMNAELISDPQQRGYHSQRDDGYPSGALWNWSYESDTSVDGGEVVSPILSDQPQDWAALRSACDAIRAGDGAASYRTGSHITVSAPEFANDASKVNRLLAVTRYFADNLEVMSRAGHDRTDDYAEPIESQPAAGYLSIRQALRRVPRHSTINIGHLHDDSGYEGLDNDCRIEYRLWDGSLEPGRIQAQVALSVALTDYASRTADAEPLKGEQAGYWYGPATEPGDTNFATSTRPIREFLDEICTSDGQKRQFAQLWAAGAWSHRR